MELIVDNTVLEVSKCLVTNQCSVYEELCFAFLNSIEEWCITESFCTFVTNKLKTYGDLIKRMFDICGVIYDNAFNAAEKLYEYNAFRDFLVVFDEISKIYGRWMGKFVSRKLDPFFIEHLNNILNERSVTLKSELILLDEQIKKEQQIQDTIKSSPYENMQTICDNIIISDHEHTCASRLKTKKLHVYYYVNMMLSLLKLNRNT